MRPPFSVIRRLDWLGVDYTRFSLVALRRRLSPGLPLSHTSQGGKRSCRSTPGGVFGSFISTIRRRLFNRVVTALTLVSGPLFVRAPRKCAESQQTSGPYTSYLSLDPFSFDRECSAWSVRKTKQNSCALRLPRPSAVAIANCVLRIAPDTGCRESSAKTSCAELAQQFDSSRSFLRSRRSLLERPASADSESGADLDDRRTFARLSAALTHAERARKCSAPSP